MKIYIDFDGVIFDTEKDLFTEYNKMLKQGININERSYLENLDWYNHIIKSGEINNSIGLLKEFKNAIILTKVCSLENEAHSKIRVLREFGVHNDIVIVPINCKKTDLVEARGNILVDDTVHNLTDWQKADGIPIYFSKDNNPIDPWGNDIRNTNYQKTKTLEILRKYI